MKFSSRTTTFSSYRLPLHHPPSVIRSWHTTRTLLSHCTDIDDR